jgi:hypothetical protein
LPKQYVWKAIYDAVSGSSLGTIDWTEKQALGRIAAAYRGDTANPANLATYIDWPWRYQVASIIDATSLDSDARAFIELSGATDEASIDAFVKGVKDLGLWESMVAWPLRITQNAGTGTTAYSLGGLGTFNGTLVNGPTWGVDGVTFPRTAASHISATRPSGSAASAAYSIFSVHTELVRDSSYRALWIGRDASNDRMFFRTTGGGGEAFSPSNLTVTPPANVNGSRSMAMTASSGDTPKTATAYGDGVASGTGTGNVSGTNSVYYIGGLAGDATRSFGFPIAFNGAFNLELSATQVAELHNLYRNTLGTGLGLP